jgi:hypothetical protein
MRLGLLLLCITVLTGSAFAQLKISAIVADSLSRQPLAFATVQSANKKTAAVADMNGVFRINLPGDSRNIIVSYSGHQSRLIPITEAYAGDTIFLAPAVNDLAEIVIRPVQDKISRIVNTVIENKTKNNPEYYDNYQCNVYYKMHVDLPGFIDDSDGIEKYLLFSETYSRRLYKRPQKLQEVILASRFSGLKKTYFTNIITDVLPFHVYSNYISLNELDYVNPISAGWQHRYHFDLQDELNVGPDTVYVLAFKPKAQFNSLRGVVYINTNGYAISHFIGNTNDTSADRQVHFEQIYSFVNGRWFPRELNYDFTIRHVVSHAANIKWNGHSVIDSVAYESLAESAFDKAHPLRLSDSVDLHNVNDWTVFRKDSLSIKEQNTYMYVDSFSKAHKLERFISMASRFNLGRVPIGKFDVDVNRFYASNQYEGSRLGLGLYTNDKISKYYSVGGWVGYGTWDKAWKYGGSLSLYPNGKKENWWEFSYEKNYGIPGEVELHEELANNFSTWLLGRVDLVKQYAIAANLQLGYWQLRPGAKYETAEPLYLNTFTVNGKAITLFTNKEASIGIRYAYGEKRYPVFDYYEPAGTKYPIVYMQLSRGFIQANGYAVNYWRTLAAVTYHHHTPRWGNDRFRLDGGFIHPADDQPMPQSYLLAANGFKLATLSFYEPEGFITMGPFDFYTDHFFSFYYKHDFDKFLWENKWSKPFISLAHNFQYGKVDSPSAVANPGLKSLTNGYHESGFLLNQAFRLNIHVADVYLNGGVFYHWNKERNWNNNSAYVLSVTAVI